MSAAPVITRPQAMSGRTPMPASGPNGGHEVLADGCVLSRSGVSPVAPLRPRITDRRPPARVGRQAAVARRAGSRGPRYAVAAPAPAGAASAALSRRGVLIVRRLTVAVAAVAALALMVAFGSAMVGHVGGGSAADGAATRTAVVQPGQTLWDVAATSGSGGDVRDTMEQIRRLNHLDGSGLQAGQRLVLPSAG